MSHTSDLLGVAVSADADLGLDVEAVKRRTVMGELRLAARRFTQAEHALLEAETCVTRRARLFVLLWTLKEAVAKARGTGISAPPGLKGFTLGLTEAPEARHQLELLTSLPSVAQPLSISLDCHTPHDQQHEHGLLLLQPTASHVAALCVRQPSGRMHAGDRVPGGEGSACGPWAAGSVARGIGGARGGGGALGVKHSLVVRLMRCVPLVDEGLLGGDAVALGSSSMQPGLPMSKL